MSGLMPSNVPVKVFPAVVATTTCLSAKAEISVMNFLCAIDSQQTPKLCNEIAEQLFNGLKTCGKCFKHTIDADSAFIELTLKEAKQYIDELKQEGYLYV